MHFLYFLVRIYPYWAIPCIILSLEMAVFYNRRKKRIQASFWSICAGLTLFLAIWIWNRGDLYAERWIAILMRALN
jgi:K+ transporter